MSVGGAGRARRGAVAVVLALVVMCGGAAGSADQVHHLLVHEVDVASEWTPSGGGLTTATAARPAPTRACKAPTPTVRLDPVCGLSGARAVDATGPEPSTGPPLRRGPPATTRA